MGRPAKNANVYGELDFPNNEHQEGSFIKTVSAFGVTWSTSVLSFRRYFSEVSLACPVSWVEFSAHVRVRSNFVGAFFPPEN